ncbi:MAG: thiamine diphosphokinase [Candidatus Limiplasma sp.]|nr:thiamine diphosphokinase [Candidatus Limiplasma sp.]
MPTCYLIGAGDFTPRGLTPHPGDLLIAADGGYRALEKTGLKPDLLVGDFDSLGFRPQDVPILTFPVEKDDTDMGLALEEGWARGYRSFALYGADGGRLDHTVANLQLLGGASARGAQVRMACTTSDWWAVTDGVLALPPRPEGTGVSVFCHGTRAQGVTLRGLQYPLLDATLTCDRPLGVSNAYRATQASVTVARGTLLVYVALGA